MVLYARYCTKCGNPLNGKAKCEKCGTVNGNTIDIISDKVKNYDYKAKAEELKNKSKDVADTLKSYDWNRYQQCIHYR